MKELVLALLLLWLVKSLAADGNQILFRACLADYAAGRGKERWEQRRYTHRKPKHQTCD